jgi:uncharacterized membrane protein YfcA
MDGDANSLHARGLLRRLVAIGLLAGLFSTLFGVGGGLVMVPLLVMVCRFDAKVATATSLAAIIGTATVGVISHGALGNVAWGYAILIGIPAVAGLLVGLAIKDRISSRTLTYAFSVVLVGVGAWLAFEPASSSARPELTLATGIAVALLGVVAGALAGLFGVGGGILFVPALVLVIGVPQLAAEGASLLAILPVSLVGSWRQHRAGTVRWHAAGVMALASAATAVAGAFLAEATPPRALRIMFALLLLATAAQLAGRVRGADAPER